MKTLVILIFVILCSFACRTHQQTDEQITPASKYVNNWPPDVKSIGCDPGYCDLLFAHTKYPEYWGKMWKGVDQKGDSVFVFFGKPFEWDK